MIKLGSIVKLVKNDGLDMFLRESGQLGAYNKELKIIECHLVTETEFPYRAKYRDETLLLMEKEVIEIPYNILLQQIYDNL